MQRPIAKGLFTEGANPRLLAGRRIADGKVVFPAPEGKSAEGFETFALEPEGVLWSYTVQRFPPKPPYIGRGAEGAAARETFRPYAVGYVEIPGQVIVESHILAPDFSSLRVGLPMRLTTYAFIEDADGAEVMTYAFEPASAPPQASA